MKDSLFRDYDNNNKYVKAPYQGATAKIGHIEYLYDYLKENLLSDWTSSNEGYSVDIVVFDTDGLYRNDVEGNTTQPSVNSPANGWTLISGIGTSSYEPTYKVYTAKVEQSDSDNPTVTVIENTLGGTISWVRVSPGGFQGTFSGTYPSADKVWCTINVKPFEFDSEFVGSLLRGATKFQMGVFSNSGTPTDGFFADIEIRVYE